MYVVYTQDNQPISIGEVIKGGSLGHGTAVPGDFDLDLVIYSAGKAEKRLDIYYLYYHCTDVDTHTMRYQGYGKWLEKLEAFLITQPKVENLTRNKFLIEFRFADLIDVDVMVSPFWNNQHEFYDFLRGIPKEERHE